MYPHSVVRSGDFASGHLDCDMLGALMLLSLLHCTTQAHQRSSQGAAPRSDARTTASTTTTTIAAAAVTTSTSTSATTAATATAASIDVGFDGGGGCDGNGDLGTSSLLSSMEPLKIAISRSMNAILENAVLASLIEWLGKVLVCKSMRLFPSKFKDRACRSYEGTQEELTKFDSISGLKSKVTPRNDAEVVDILLPSISMWPSAVVSLTSAIVRAIIRVLGTRAKVVSY